MTKLDAKALEAAMRKIAEITKYACTDTVIAREAITAYIDALPRATRATGFYLDDGSLVVSRGHTFGRLSEGIARSEGALIEVEIREVREP